MQKTASRKTPPFCSALDFCLLRSFQPLKLGFVPTLIDEVTAPDVDADQMGPLLLRFLSAGKPAAVPCSVRDVLSRLIVIQAQPFFR